MIEHPENYRWSNIGRSRFDCIRINVELMEMVLIAKKDYKSWGDNVKLGDNISHSVYPPIEGSKPQPKISHTIYPPNYEPPRQN
jgi:hypothetical protein